MLQLSSHFKKMDCWDLARKKKWVWSLDKTQGWRFGSIIWMNVSTIGYTSNMALNRPDRFSKGAVSLQNTWTSTFWIETSLMIRDVSQSSLWLDWQPNNFHFIFLYPFDNTDVRECTWSHSNFEKTEKFVK